MLCLSIGNLITLPEGNQRWRCDDPAHPGPLIINHLADMLFNYVLFK